MKIEQLRNNLKQALVSGYSMLSMSRETIIDEVVDEYEKSLNVVAVYEGKTNNQACLHFKTNRFISKRIHEHKFKPNKDHIVTIQEKGES
jgi:hypothetical protein